MIGKAFQKLNERFFAWFHRGQEPDEPCSYMKPTLSEIADGTLPDGLRRRYAERHLLDCPFCQNGLFNLLLLRERLHSIRYGKSHNGHGSGAEEKGAEELTLTAETRTFVEMAWKRLDERPGTGEL